MRIEDDESRLVELLRGGYAPPSGSPADNGRLQRRVLAEIEEGRSARGGSTSALLAAALVALIVLGVSTWAGVEGSREGDPAQQVARLALPVSS